MLSNVAHGLSPVVTSGCLIAVVSLVLEPGLQRACGQQLQSIDSRAWAQLPRGICSILSLGSEIKSVSPTLTESQPLGPQGKSPLEYFFFS